jgi:hypothetical protein
MIEVWFAAGAGLLLATSAVLLLRRGKPVSIPQARLAFQQQREHLESEFFRLAASGGKPRGLRWVECAWENLLEFARDRQSGMLTALAGVTIRFEAIAGGDMEGLPAVGNLRNGTGVFIHDGSRWRATGRVVFNLNPDEVIAHFPQQFERVASS